MFEGVGAAGAAAGPGSRSSARGPATKTKDIGNGEGVDPMVAHAAHAAAVAAAAAANAATGVAAEVSAHLEMYHGSAGGAQVSV